MQDGFSEKKTGEGDSGMQKYAPDFFLLRVSRMPMDGVSWSVCGRQVRNAKRGEYLPSGTQERERERRDTRDPRKENSPALHNSVLYKPKTVW